jgi:hypothetical protein
MADIECEPLSLDQDVQQLVARFSLLALADGFTGMAITMSSSSQGALADHW